MGCPPSCCDIGLPRQIFLFIGNPPDPVSIFLLSPSDDRFGLHQMVISDREWQNHQQGRRLLADYISIKQKSSAIFWRLTVDLITR